MKKLITIPCIFLLFLANTNAQSNSEKDRNAIAASIGVAVTYYYGPGDRNFGKFEDERVNWQINSMLGLTLARDKDGKRTIVGAFGQFGFNNANTISQILSDQSYTTSTTSQSTANSYYQIEAGLLIVEKFRISTGVGQQHFDPQILLSGTGGSVNSKQLKFYSSTVGLQLNFGNLGWVLNCNIAYGKDFDHTIIIPSTGFNYRF